MSHCLTELLWQHPSNGWQRTSSTGITPSHGSHATAPIACDGFTTENRYHARAVAGREYHCPHYRSSPHRELPGGYSWLVSLPGGENKPKSKRLCPFVVHHWQIMAQPLWWLLLITKVMGKYLMDGYSVVKGQTRFQKTETGGDFRYLHLFPNLKAKL